MIKIALKHYLYETCINVIFDKILSNFSIDKYIDSRFKGLSTGDRFSHIAYCRSIKLRNWNELEDADIPRNFENCEIVSISSHMLVFKAGIDTLSEDYFVINNIKDKDIWLNK